MTTTTPARGNLPAEKCHESAKPFLRKVGNSSTQTASLRFGAISQGGGRMQAFSAQSHAQQRFSPAPGAANTTEKSC